jgi:hypothetical protein
MYKKLLSINAAQATGLNKAENVTISNSTSPVTVMPAASIHHHGSNSSNNSSDVDVNDENAPSNFHSTTTSSVVAIENNGSDKVIYESPYERPLMSIHTSQQHSHHHHHHTTSPSHLSSALTKMECDEDYATTASSALQHLHHHHHTPYPVHKSIHHMASAAHYREMAIDDDENLENRQQNFVKANGDEEEEPWRPW